VNRLESRRELLQPVIEDSEWVCIEKRRTVPIDSHVLVIELDVTASQIRVVSVLMEAEHQVPIWFDPIDPVVLVVDARGVPEANLQSRSLRVVRITQERRWIDIRDHVSRSASRRPISYVLTACLIRQPIVNIFQKRPLCIAVTTGEKDHL
jgi:hypothetical protein